MGVFSLDGMVGLVCEHGVCSVGVSGLGAGCVLH